MIPTYDLDEDQWNLLVQDVADNFDDVTLSRGFQYYKQGRVVKLTLPSQRYVKAQVEGTERYFVEINLDFFTASYCDCPVNGFCKHMFAVILKYADMHNRSVHTLVNAKMTAMSRPDPKPSHAKSYNQAKQLAEKKAAENERLLKEQAQRIPEMSIAQWHELFELRNESLTQGSRNTQFVHDSLKSLLRMKPSLPDNLEQLYALHAQLFVLSKLTKQPQDQSGYVYSYLAFHTHHAASDLQESIGQSIANAATMAAKQSNEQLVEQTLTYLRNEMLAETNNNHYFLSHYQAIWSQWIHPATQDAFPIYSEELLQLERASGDAGQSLSPLARRVAQAAMYQYQTNDQEALRLLTEANEISNIPSDSLTPFLAHLSQSGQWKRLTQWLVEITPLLNLRRNASIRPYTDFWELAVHHLPEVESLMWDTFVSLLPHTRALYEEKLLANGKWERWMDYHLSINSDPMDFRVTDLHPLEKNAPEILLPFYHQAVERYVLIKNRDGYKAAVKLMKRLAKLYKKLKQEPRWEHFLASFISRNSRLRALQEELRKGKLVP
ncbi:SWIM zinc finger family protein [Cohnella luojiensis]|uniref:SWIM-type domain-containing protein n=1 Tax=Cohnella luojiensis TaxID=652876 RepID=A0A4Y8M137_9BACL|nr:hypothetical protein [Cohnella luojiensis]TFE25523.1 hypothetical protein E2980_13085 [Cohnella luojiensis]